MVLGVGGGILQFIVFMRGELSFLQNSLFACFRGAWNSSLKASSNRKCMNGIGYSEIREALILVEIT